MSTFSSLLGIKIKMSSNETVFGNDCQLAFAASEEDEGTGEEEFVFVFGLLFGDG